MRIGMYTMTYVPTPDGVAYYVYEVKREMNRLGHDVYILTCGNDIGGRVKKKGDIFRFPSWAFPPYPVYRAPMFPFIRGLSVSKHLDPDILHAHTPFLFGTMAHLYKRQSGKPLVFTFHTDFDSMKGTLGGYVLNEHMIGMGWGYSSFLYRRADMVLAPTEIMAKKLRALKDMWAPVKVVWDGIDPSQYCTPPRFDIRRKHGISQDQQIVLFLSRLTTDKGVYTLLEASKEVHKKTGAAFIMAGTGPELENLKKKAKEENAEEHFKVIGYVSEEEKKALYHAADVFVLPSKAETFGMVLLEAMACKTPVIGAESGGITEVIRDGQNGLFFPWGDADELAQRILMILEDKNTRNKLISGGYRFVTQEASIANSARRTLEIYEEVSRK